jgi:hypothetical protein
LDRVGRVLAVSSGVAESKSKKQEARYRSKNLWFSDLGFVVSLFARSCDSRALSCLLRAAQSKQDCMLLGQFGIIVRCFVFDSVMMKARV